MNADRWQLTPRQMEALDAYVHAGSEAGAAKRLQCSVRLVERWLDEARCAMRMPHRVAAVVEWTVYRLGLQELRQPVRWPTLDDEEHDVEQLLLQHYGGQGRDWWRQALRQAYRRGVVVGEGMARGGEVKKKAELPWRDQQRWLIWPDGRHERVE